MVLAKQRCLGSLLWVGIMWLNFTNRPEKKREIIPCVKFEVRVTNSKYMHADSINFGPFQIRSCSLELISLLWTQYSESANGAD